MRGLSNRELEARFQWVENQWNNPSRSDYYQMQVAMEVKRVLASKPKEIKLEHFKIPFKFKREGAVFITKEQAAAWAKSRWMGVVGMGKYVLDKVTGVVTNRDK